MPLPATRIAPVRPAVPPLAATPYATVPLPLPAAPPAIDSHGAFVEAVHAMFAVTAMKRPPEASAGTFVEIGLMVIAGASPICATVQVRTMPPPATSTAPVRPDRLPLAATLYVTVPLPLPAAPPAIDSHGAFVEAVHATFAVRAMVRPLDAAAGTLVAAGSIVSAAAAPACTTVQVRTMPPPATNTAPVRPAVRLLAATPYVIVPLAPPAPPAAIVNHDALVAAVHATFAVTTICRPLDAAAGTLVAAGLIVSVEAPIPVPEAAKVFAPLVLSEFTVTVPP